MPCLRAKPATACAGADFAGPMHALFAIGLPLRQPVGAQHQAPRRRIERHRLVRNLELLEQQPQIFERARNHPIGNLFGADFEQERQAHCGHLRRRDACCCWSAQACATPTASLRTRWMTPTRSVTLMAPRASSVLKMFEHFSTWS